MQSKYSHTSLPSPAVELPVVLSAEQVNQLLAAMVSQDVFDTEGAAKYLGVSKQLLELLRVQGGGPRYAKLQRLVRYRRVALDAWLIERERYNTAEH